MQLVVYIKKLGIKAILHPGSLFALIWLMSTLSQFLLIQIDLALIYEPSFINEINIFVICTSLFFIFWIAVNPYNSYFERKQFTFKININSLKILLKITLIGAFFIMLYTWYKLGVSSLNIAELVWCPCVEPGVRWSKRFIIMSGLKLRMAQTTSLKTWSLFQTLKVSSGCLE